MISDTEPMAQVHEMVADTARRLADERNTTYQKEYGDAVDVIAAEIGTTGQQLVRDLQLWQLQRARQAKANGKTKAAGRVSGPPTQLGVEVGIAQDLSLFGITIADEVPPTLRRDDEHSMRHALRQMISHMAIGQEVPLITEDIKCLRGYIYKAAREIGNVSVGTSARKQGKKEVLVVKRVA